MGNSSCKIFDFDFYIENEEQLKVFLIDENDIKKELKHNIDYSINEFKNKSGSFITFPIENSNYEILKENQKISLELNLEISQEVQYNNSSLLNLETLEYSLDYLTRLIQILNRKIALCLKVEEGLSATPDEMFNSIKTSVINCEESKNFALKYKNETENVAQITQEKLTQVEELSNNINPENYLLKECSNIDKEGKSAISSFSMPSNNSITLEAGASGSTYTAPANGYFSIRGDALSASLAQVALWRKDGGNFGTRSYSYAATAQPWVYLPVKKGEVIGISVYNLENILFKFFYAEGEV